MLQYLKELALISRKADTKLGKIIEIAKNSSLKDVNAKSACYNAHTKTTEPYWKEFPVIMCKSYFQTNEDSQEYYLRSYTIDFQFPRFFRILAHRHDFHFFHISFALVSQPPL